MLSKVVQDAINEQIKSELYSRVIWLEIGICDLNLLGKAFGVGCSESLSA